MFKYLFQILLHYVEQIVLFLGQSRNVTTYHRRQNFLGTIINSQYQVKTILKENVSFEKTSWGPAWEIFSKSHY